MSDCIESDYFANIFRNKMCSVCQMCNGIDPSFCIMIFANDATGFTNMVKNLTASKEIGRTDIINEFYTFEGFCGIFCNGKINCIGATEQCQNIDSMFGCYEAFLRGAQGEFDQKKLNILAAMAGVTPTVIGKKYSSRLETMPSALPKNKRKKLTKKFKKIKHILTKAEWVINSSSAKDKKEGKKRSAPIETEFFCNDNDEEWKERIDTLLNEIDN